jgi:hypothetical protein
MQAFTDPRQPRSATGRAAGDPIQPTEKEQYYMRVMKMIGALLLVVAFAAIGTATASAAETLWKMLPGTKGTTFTGKSGKATLQIKGSGSITCPSSSTTNGELTEEQTLALATIEFIKCTIGGLPINSLGDGSGIILVHLEIHDCTISAGKAGILIKILPLHLEIPSTKLLLSVEGSLITELTPNKTKSKTFSLIVEQKEGKQAIEKCEGGSALTLTTSLDGGAFIQSAEEAKEGTLTFASEQEAMA